MSAVRLLGSVPVTVVVDMDERRVTRVIVHDDAFDWTFPGAATEDGEPVSRAREKEAQAIADSAEWPGWDLGY
jgi:hypothetical protein